MDTKDQINSTLVAGALIFLSLSITFPDDTNPSNNTTTNKTTNDTKLDPKGETMSGNILPALVDFVAIIFFALSAFVAIAAEWDRSNNVFYERSRKASMMLMIVGFLALIAISLAVVMSLSLAS